MAVCVMAVAGVFAAAPAMGSDEQDTPLPQAVTGIMAKPLYANASWGLREIGPSGATLFSRRATEQFVPGSSAKLFSVSAAWKVLGPNHRFTTPVYATGRRTGSTLNGDLVLVGSGDPSLGGRTTRDGGIAWTDVDHADASAGLPGISLTPQDPLAGINALARQVHRAGIRDVRGDVIVDARLFTATYDPQPTPVMINDNLVDLVATPTTPGHKARLSHRPAAATLDVVADVKTVRAGQPSQMSVSGQAPGRVTVTGTVAAGSKPLIQIAPIADPATFARTVFIQALRKAGVRVRVTALAKNPRPQRSRSYPKSSRVAAYVSPPYADYAKWILKVSSNIGANDALCLLAAQAGQSDCDGGYPSMRAFLKRAGVSVEQMVLADGRGGDPVDRASPMAVTQLLRYWLTQPDFDAFRTSLPILGVDGSLEDNAVHTPARGKVFAKTGTALSGDPLNGRPLVVQAKALAGFFSQADGRWRAFDVVANNAGGGKDFQPFFDASNDLGNIGAQLWQQANP